MITRASRISRHKYNRVLQCFILDTTAAQAASFAKVSRNCANLYFTHFREAMYESMRRAPWFEGEVEIDQTFFGGRGKKKEYALVRRLAGLETKDIIKTGKKLRKQNKIQVIGLLRRQGDVYTQIIKKADERTIMPLLRLVVAQGSTIYTDFWSAFSKIKFDGYTHEAINHSAEYSNKKGRHINGIESFWSFCKGRLSKFKGISRGTLPLHIKECEFRYNHKNDLKKALTALLSSNAHR